MEIDGHPSQDLVEELERRGGVKIEGTAAGPRVDSLRFLTERLEDAPGIWVFLPREAYLTGVDESPV